MKFSNYKTSYSLIISKLQYLITVIIAAIVCFGFGAFRGRVSREQAQETILVIIYTKVAIIYKEINKEYSMNTSPDEDDSRIC